ncbi:MULTISPECIES: NAD(P)-dependent alcohol dehydrogenase [unclassified Xanthomonas]|uniref:NAD(P)-dependent alcohol dehydrogenase n=1 Tax=unclassified Xanthomonas TaxID=2643310 RepID=UPI0028834F25|nr:MULTISPECIES: NAD(P)-dependent alcohol dehydrogenase [unclassified Xanthomonas]
MKRLQYNRYGGQDVMQLAEFTLGAPAKGQVAVKVKYAAINPVDWKMRNGVMKIVTGRTFPRAMGMDLSGVVLAVGEGVTRFKPGDAVFGLARFKECGALGEAVITTEESLVKKPDNVSYENAACLGTPGVTAWNGLVDKAALKKGQHVFVNGCAGAVGEAAVQLAQLLGATVSGSCSARSMERARSLGLKQVYDYRVTRPEDIHERFDVIFDTSAVMKAAAGLALLRDKRGSFLDLEPDLGKFVRAVVDRRFKLVIGKPSSAILAYLASAAESGTFGLPIGEIVPLENAIGLMNTLESGQKRPGKGLVRMD